MRARFDCKRDVEAPSPTNKIHAYIINRIIFVGRGDSRIARFVWHLFNERTVGDAGPYHVNPQHYGGTVKTVPYVSENPYHVNPQSSFFASGNPYG